jgi:F-type H+-transporting ATPase subunit b
MITELFPLAEATGQAVAAHGEAASGVTKIFTDFGIDLPFILAQAINFSVVAFILWRFAFKPVAATLEQRQKQIEAGLKDAADIRAKLAATHQETLQILQKAHAEAAQIIDNARRAAKEFSEREQKAATGRANEIIEKAQQAIELERKKMVQQTRGEIARLVVSTTQKVLAKELSDFERSRFNEAAAKELTNV